MPRPRTVLYTSAIFLALHAALWLYVAETEPSHYPWAGDVRSLFEYWDAWHYNLIIKGGYFGREWVFYPLYPLVVVALARLLGLSSRPEIVGAIFSTLCFAAFCLWQARLAGAGDVRLRPLLPASLWGWLFFLLWPGSWVFHSHHTEALFLLLSFAALYCSRAGRWRAAALFAGLCALTRAQGVFLALAVALDCALRLTGARRRTLVFLGCCAISLLLFACFPAYQLYRTGDALKFIHEQAVWEPVSSLREYAATFWFANRVQSLDWDNYRHHALFFALTGAGVALARRREWALALYVVASAWSQLHWGHLLNTYRYGAALFPALFLLGDATARLPAPARWALFAALAYLNYLCASNYAAGVWAY